MRYWSSHLTSLNLSFPSCNVGTVLTYPEDARINVLVFAKRLTVDSTDTCYTQVNSVSLFFFFSNESQLIYLFFVYKANIQFIHLGMNKRQSASHHRFHFQLLGMFISLAKRRD